MSYDQMGRTLYNFQCTPENCPTNFFTVSYVYDLFGDMTSTVYAGVRFSYAYNAAAQVTGVTSSLTGSNYLPTLLSGISYTPPGDVSQLQFGNGMAEADTYTNRLWLQGRTVTQPPPAGGTYTFALGFAGNGDVKSGNDSLNGNWTYGYDDLNRLSSASQTGLAYTYTYDRYGNRWNQKLNGGCTAGTSFCISFDNNNHVANGVLTYDLAGNVLSDSAHHYTYDAENRITQVDSGATAMYVYDAEGQRVRKTAGGG
jgi:YD repeat-containing protein